MYYLSIYGDLKGEWEVASNIVLHQKIFNNGIYFIVPAPLKTSDGDQPKYHQVVEISF